MAFNVAPAGIGELLNIAGDPELVELYNFLRNTLPNTTPLIFDPKNLKKIKIHRNFESLIDLDSITSKYKKYKFNFGNGSINGDNKGFEFEKNIFNIFNNIIKNKILPDEKDKIINLDKHSGYFVYLILIEIKKMYGDFELLSVEHEGNKKVIRTLNISDNEIILNNGDNNIGERISDITLNIKSQSIINKVFISLKYGKTISFCNFGIKKIVQEYNFNKLLEFFNISKNNFDFIINNYNNKEKKFFLKNEITHNIEYYSEFLKGSIGYNYIYAHFIGNSDYDIFFIDNNKLNEMTNISRVYSIVPEGASSKCFNILLDCITKKYKIVMRNKNGGIIPNSILVHPVK